MISEDTNYAPIILMAYNRDAHFKITLEALSLNINAINSSLYCYLDGPKDEDDSIAQEKIIDIVNEYKKHFKQVEIIIRKKNFGLALNISQAVTEIISIYEKVIVIEDDVVTSKSFIDFMNNALNFYEHDNRIWHIAAHSEINFEERKNEIYIWKVMNCWGWATWKNRWQHFEKNPEQLINEFSEDMIRDFDLDGSGYFWHQVVANASKRIDTWAIFWYATIFKNNGFCVNPYFSHTKNIGLDGSGAHCDIDKDRMRSQILNHNGKFSGKNEIIEDTDLTSSIRNIYIARRTPLNYIKKAYASRENLFKYINKLLKFFTTKINN